MLIYYLALIFLWPAPGYMMRPSSSTANSNEQIDHTQFLVSNISNIYLSNDFWDVQLVVDGEPLHAHRIILALSSGYFRDFFYKGEEKPNMMNVILSEVPVTLFKKHLKYMYSGQIEVFLENSSVLGSDALKLFEMSDHFRISYYMVSDISKLYLSKSYSDVVLVVVGERVFAHRAVLASWSEYFMILFFGGLKETYNKDVEINDVPVPLFKVVLNYLYTGRMNLSDFEGKDIFELLKMADFFRISNLKISLHNYLQSSIDVNDVCSFLTMTQTHQFKELELESLKLIDNNALEVLHKDDFLNLSPGPLEDILSRDTFFVNELDIFKAVCRWINKNQNELDSSTKIKVLSVVRYSLMSDEVLSKAMESHLVSPDIIFEAIKLRKTLSFDKPRFRVAPRW